MPSNIPSETQLVHSSSRFAQKALEFHNTYDFEFVPIFAVTAIEHITKACLISKHPTLLLEFRSRDTLNSLLFLNEITPNMPDGFKTVGLSEALKRVKPFIESKSNEIHLNQLINLGDGSIHIADASKTETDLLVAFITQVNSSLDFLGVQKDSFWGKQNFVADQIIGNHLSQITRDVVIKMEQSWVRFETKMATLPFKALNEIVRHQPQLNFGELRLKCPVCKCLAIVGGDLELIYHEDPEGNDEKIGAGIPVLFANFLTCHGCDFRLSSSDELDACGLGSTFNPNEGVLEIQKFLSR